MPETSDGVEVQLSLFPPKEQLSKGPHSYKFKILSIDENHDWHDHCAGFIGLELKTIGNEANWKQNLPRLSSMEAFSLGQQLCTQAIDTKDFYESVQKLGIDYGEAFQHLVNIRQGPLNL